MISGRWIHKACRRWRARVDAGVLRTEDVVEEIRRERRRQVEEEGITPELDDRFSDGRPDRLVRGVITGLKLVLRQEIVGHERIDLCWWEKHDDRRRLVIAAAVLVAEIERRDRAAGRERE